MTRQNGNLQRFQVWVNRPDWRDDEQPLTCWAHSRSEAKVKLLSEVNFLASHAKINWIEIGARLAGKDFSDTFERDESDNGLTWSELGFTLWKKR